MNSRTSRTLDGVTYAPGAKFRVITTGARLTGMRPDRPGAWRGWEQRLVPGDIVTCTGFGAGWGSDPGYGVEFTSGQSDAEHAGSCDIWPKAGGLFNYRPTPGILEPVTDDDA